LLAMNLDRFREVNASLGHDAGDRLLVEVGRRLLSVARRSDSFARIGGDEFAAILPGVDSVVGAMLVAERVGAAVREPIPIGDQEAVVGMWIGIALFPAHGEDGGALLAHADRAMRRAKHGSRGYEVFCEETASRARSSFLIARHLSEALDHNQLFLHYQPKV